MCEYDDAGNILTKNEYAYTNGTVGEPTSTVTYGYTDSDWGDLLTTYNGQDIDYDEIGNPLYIKDAENNVVKSYTWEQGRQLKTLSTADTTWTYTYDINGLRTGRTDGTNTYEYIYAGDKLVRMIRNGEIVDFGYAGGRLTTMTYDGVTYYYILNGQGDVIALTDNTGRVVLGYTYGAYGTPRLLLADETLTMILKDMNPFLYRGYVYDIESTLYYLQSRYYDPELGRFINADAYASTGQGILGNNMFAYCLNNPTNGSDPCGTCFHNGSFWEDCDECKDKSFWQKICDVGKIIYESQQAFAQEQQYQTRLQMQLLIDGYYRVKTEVSNLALAVSSAVGKHVEYGKLFLKKTFADVNWDTVAIDTLQGGLVGGIGSAVANAYACFIGAPLIAGVGVLPCAIAGGMIGMVGGTVMGFLDSVIDQIQEAWE